MRFHPGDSASYRVRDMPWLYARCAERRLARPDFVFKQILHYEGPVKLGGELTSPFAERSGSCLFVEGDLDVPGEIYVSADALWVLGTVHCERFVAYDPLLVIAEGIHARRFASFTALGGTSPEIDTLETPILLRSSAEADLVMASIARPRIEHVVNRDDAPDGIGDFPLLDFFRARSPAFLAALRAGGNAWALIASPKLSPRLQKIVTSVRKGATLEWTQLSGRSAARILHADGARQTVALTQEEEAALRAELKQQE